jgi:hypothetical protein
MSKLAFVESEYFLAIKVIGQNNLKINNTSPSIITKPIHIQTQISILLLITAYIK